MTRPRGRDNGSDTARWWVAIIAVVAIAHVLSVSARGAEPPPTLGATIGATETTFVVDSSASVAQLVTIEASEGWALAETTFVIEPGDRRRVAITESGPKGAIVATFQAVDLPIGMDTSTLVLSLGVAPPTPTFLPWALLALGLILAVAFTAAVHRRTRHAR